MKTEFASPFYTQPSKCCKTDQVFIDPIPCIYLEEVVKVKCVVVLAALLDCELHVPILRITDAQCEMCADAVRLGAVHVLQVRVGRKASRNESALTSSHLCGVMCSKNI